MVRTRRIAGTALLTGALVLGPAVGALAHECMVVNRSQRAEQALAKSPMWLSENMATHEAYEFTFEVVFEVTPTEEQLDEAVAAHIEQGLQEWTSFFMHHTLLTDPKSDPPVNNPAGDKHQGDGKGVEHWSDTELGQAMIAIAADILGV